MRRCLLVFSIILLAAFLSGCDTASGPGVEETYFHAPPARDGLLLQDVVAWPATPGDDTAAGAGRDRLFVPVRSDHPVPRYHCITWARVGPPSTTPRRWTYQLNPSGTGTRDGSRVKRHSVPLSQRLAYQLQAADGTPLRTAMCVVPAGEAAALEVEEALRFDGPAEDVTSDADLCTDRMERCRVEQVREAGVGLPSGIGFGPVRTYLMSGSVSLDDALRLQSTCDDGDGGGGGGCGEIDPDEDNGQDGPDCPPVIAVATNSCGGPGDSPCIDCPSGEEPASWGKAMRIGRKAFDAAKRGEDLLDWRTWRDILDSEWAEAVQAAADGPAALNGDPVALISVLDYAFSQVNPAGFGLFESLKVLKAGDYLGQTWYDDVIGYFRGSQYAGELVNRIGNLETIEAIATKGERLFGKWVMPDGTSTSQIISTFESKWNTSAEFLDSGGRIRLFSPDGSIVMTRYPSTNTSYWGIDINFVDENRILKIRAGQ